MNAGAPTSVPPGTVLVIDDDAVIRMVVREALQDVGYVVTEAGEPEDGIEVACAQEPDLIILDIMLPRMDGLAVLTVLRDRGVTSRIIVFSATGAHSAERALQLGASAYISKPFELVDMIQTVNGLLADGHAA